MASQQHDDGRDRPHPRGGGAISDEQADAIDALSGDIAYRGKSRLAILAALPPERKWPYFRDELLARTAAIVAAVAIVIYLAVQILTPQAAPQLTVAVMQGALGDQDAAALQTNVAQALKLPEGRKGGVRVDTGYDLNDSASLSKLQTLLSAHEIDMIIASPSDFEQLAGFGYFRPLTKALDDPLRTELKDAFTTFAGYDDSKDTDIDYDGSGKGASAPYGLALADAPRWSALGSADKDALAGFVLDSPNGDNAQRFIAYLTDRDR
ncbi:hypothetical protein [Bifidobacterium aerophilum]|uniref:Uncharacterized protein n=1 Tax=Bifidobacterium aerophilum TaxID=1798155 RepID=A0A6N9Z6F0_9BIFI|nr:hypothetical protein [Bifidobacterium aerophilum]NEG89934.1 hypothetical protein [Bifidobacterium aerophilum]